MRVRGSWVGLDQYGMAWRGTRENKQILPVELEEGKRGSGTGLDDGQVQEIQSCENKPLEVCLEPK
jgi:hypothetical protein